MKGFIEYFDDMDDIHRNIQEYNSNKEQKTLTFLMIWLLIYLVIKNLIQY